MAALRIALHVSRPCGAWPTSCPLVLFVEGASDVLHESEDEEHRERALGWRLNRLVLNPDGGLGYLFGLDFGHRWRGTSYST